MFRSTRTARLGCTVLFALIVYGASFGGGVAAAVLRLKKGKTKYIAVSRLTGQVLPPGVLDVTRILASAADAEIN